MLFQLSWNFSLGEVKQGQQHTRLTWGCRWGGCCCPPAAWHRASTELGTQQGEERGSHPYCLQKPAPEAQQKCFQGLMKLKCHIAVWLNPQITTDLRAGEPSLYRMRYLWVQAISARRVLPVGNLSISQKHPRGNKQSPFSLKVLLQAVISIGKIYTFLEARKKAEENLLHGCHDNYSPVIW